MANSSTFRWSPNSPLPMVGVAATARSLPHLRVKDFQWNKTRKRLAEAGSGRGHGEDGHPSLLPILKTDPGHHKSSAIDCVLLQQVKTLKAPMSIITTCDGALYGATNKVRGLMTCRGSECFAALPSMLRDKAFLPTTNTLLSGMKNAVSHLMNKYVLKRSMGQQSQFQKPPENSQKNHMTFIGKI